MLVLDTEVEMLSALAFAPDGRELAVFGRKGSGRFAVPDGRKLGPLPDGGWQRAWYADDRLFVLHPGCHTLDPGGAIAIGPVEQTVAAVADDGQTLVTATTTVRRVPRARRGRRAGGDDFRTINHSVLRILDREADDWRERWAVELQDHAPGLGALSPCGRWLGTGRRYGEPVQVWDAESGVWVRDLPAVRVVDVRFAAGRLLAFSRSHLFVWDANDWDREPLTIYGGQHERLDDLAVHPDGRRAFLTNFARTVLVVDLAAGGVTTTMDWGVPLLSRVAVSADGTLAAAGNHGGQVVLWDLDP